jgi:hypothetical protein
MKTSLIKVYVLGLLFVITFGHSNFFGGRFESQRLLQEAVPDTTMITLPPDFVVLNANLTLYYQFNANSANVAPTGTPPADVTAAPTDATIPPADATVAPTDATIPPADATAAPTDATTLPADTTIPPADATTPTTATIDFYIVLQGNSSIALAFIMNATNDTIDMDSVVCQIANGTIVVADFYLANVSNTTGLLADILDVDQGGTNDWTLVNYSMNATTVIVHISRLQNTGDLLDFVFTGPGNYTIGWAISPDFATDVGVTGATDVILVDNTNATVNAPAEELPVSTEGGV